MKGEEQQMKQWWKERRVEEKQERAEVSEEKEERGEARRVPEGWVPPSWWQQHLMYPALRKASQE